MRLIANHLDQVQEWRKTIESDGLVFLAFNEDHLFAFGDGRQRLVEDAKFSQRPRGGMERGLVNILMVPMVTPFGDFSLAAYGLTRRLEMFTNLGSMGLGRASGTLVGQNLGAGKPDRAQKSVWITCLSNMVFLASIGLVFSFYAPQMVRLLSNDSASLQVAAQCLRTISLTYPLLAAGMVLIQAFNGAGDTRTPTWINFFCYWLFQIPLAYVLGVHVDLGPWGGVSLFWWRSQCWRWLRV